MNVFVPAELIEQKIFLIRGYKVMFDKDLAALYKVATRDLNKAVSRNKERFPKDFMFQLTKSESKNLMFQFGTSSWGGTRKPPHVFTEHGILMLSSVLNSPRAIQVNIQIVRTFLKLRRLLVSHKHLKKRIDDMESKYDRQFKVVFQAIRQLLTEEEKPKRQP